MSYNASRIQKRHIRETNRNPLEIHDVMCILEASATIVFTMSEGDSPPRLTVIQCFQAPYVIPLNSVKTTRCYQKRL